MPTDTDVVDGLARMDRASQNRFLARTLSVRLRLMLAGFDAERRRIIESRWDRFFDPEPDSTKWTRRFLNTRIEAGKDESRFSIMNDPDDYAMDLIAFLLEDENWT